LNKKLLTLTDVYKTSTEDQDKSMPPAETVRRVKEKFSQLELDILAETVRIDNGRLDIPVFFSVCGSDAARLTGTTKQMGKGATPAQAEASAVMELVERFSIYSFAENPENFIVDTYDRVWENALPFELIARSVHDESADRDIAREIFSELPLKWTWGHDLTNNRKMLVPFDWFFAINAFNGTSAGNCAEEALCQGICEIVERHVSARVCRENIQVSGIDPASAAEPVVADLLKKFKQNGISLYLSDFTLDMGIPTIGVLAHDPATHPEKSEIVWTAGTTPNPEKALSRALSETAQLGGDFNTGSNYVASGLPKPATLAEVGFITLPEKYVSLSDLPDVSDNNMKVEIENCISALEKKNMPVITIPTAHPQLSVPAFYTLIPGAHFRERAEATSVAMFCGKLITEKYPPQTAVHRLEWIDNKLPGKYFIKFYMGTCCLELDQPKTALSHFRAALDLEPDPQDIPSIYSYMGLCHKNLGGYQKALEVLHQGIQWDADRTDIYNLMGFCYFKLGEHQKAIGSFEQVIRLNPNSAIDYANIATNYRELGDTEAAISYYQIALSIDPEIGFARENLEKLGGGE